MFERAKKKFPDYFEIVQYLKMDKLDENILIKSNWNITCDYFADILCSETLKSAFMEIYNSDSLFPDKKEIKEILNSMRFFYYSTDFVAETKKRFLSIYIQASITEKISLNINIKKCIYLALFLITCVHEILGHLYIRIHNYLFDEKKKFK